MPELKEHLSVEEIERSIAFHQRESRRLKIQLAYRRGPRKWGRPRRILGDQVGRARELRAQGRSYLEVGREVGLTKGSVYRALKSLETPASTTTVATGAA